MVRSILVRSFLMTGPKGNFKVSTMLQVNFSDPQNFTVNISNEYQKWIPRMNWIAINVRPAEADASSRRRCLREAAWRFCSSLLWSTLLIHIDAWLWVSSRRVCRLSASFEEGECFAPTPGTFRRGVWSLLSTTNYDHEKINKFLSGSGWSFSGLSTSQSILRICWRFL